MAINGQIARWFIDIAFIALIGTFGFVANKADTKVERHETRIQDVEKITVKIDTKLDYVIKSLDEIKREIRRGRP